MAEYIEREAALKAIHDEWDEVCNYDGSGHELANEMESAIDSVPAADVVPVVRCKDCKYGVPTKNGLLDDMIACENKDSPCGYSSWLCQPDWFCADGERREAPNEP